MVRDVWCVGWIEDVEVEVDVEWFFDFDVERVVEMLGFEDFDVVVFCLFVLVLCCCVDVDLYEVVDVVFFE